MRGPTEIALRERYVLSASPASHRCHDQDSSHGLNIVNSVEKTKDRRNTPMPALLFTPPSREGCRGRSPSADLRPWTTHTLHTLSSFCLHTSTGFGGRLQNPPKLVDQTQHQTWAGSTAATVLTYCAHSFSAIFLGLFPYVSATGVVPRCFCSTLLQRLCGRSPATRSCIHILCVVVRVTSQQQRLFLATPSLHCSTQHL
jgi:hypothetical protein